MFFLSLSFCCKTQLVSPKAISAVRKGLQCTAKNCECVFDGEKWVGMREHRTSNIWIRNWARHSKGKKRPFWTFRHARHIFGVHQTSSFCVSIQLIINHWSRVEAEKGYPHYSKSRLLKRSQTKLPLNWIMYAYAYTFGNDEAVSGFVAHQPLLRDWRPTSKMAELFILPGGVTAQIVSPRPLYKRKKRFLIL